MGKVGGMAPEIRVKFELLFDKMNASVPYETCNLDDEEGETYLSEMKNWVANWNALDSVGKKHVLIYANQIMRQIRD